jgi:peptidyl-prolyl cis-trans isomerase C
VSAQGDSAAAADSAAGVRVNGVEIAESEIAAETQNHPADTVAEARREAVLSLVVRELLLQEARAHGFVPVPEDLGEGRRETDEDSLIRQLLEDALDLPEADEEACRRYYENNRARFASPTLYEAAHIFFPAPPEDAAARAAAREKAEAAIAELQRAPERFATLAQELSACSSAQDGGRLGQVTRGQTTPEFETFLDALEPGQLCHVPVSTPYGMHVVRLDERIEGRELAFGQVRETIADYLRQSVWQRAVHQYIRMLAGKAEIEGVDLDGASNPLVQ